MTYATALENAIATLSNMEQTEVTTYTIEKLQTLHDTLVKRAATLADSDKRQAANAKRKADTAAARAALMEKVLPALRAAITDEEQTVDQIYATAQANLPADFNVRKVSYVLTHEMAPEIVKIDNGRNNNTYKRKA